MAVIVRAKPPAPAESPLIVSMTKKSATITLPYRKNKEPVRTFTFDRCYWSANKLDPNYASQEVVFNEVRGGVAFAGELPIVGFPGRTPPWTLLPPALLPVALQGHLVTPSRCACI